MLQNMFFNYAIQRLFFKNSYFNLWATHNSCTILLIAKCRNGHKILIVEMDTRYFPRIKQCCLKTWPWSLLGAFTLLHILPYRHHKHQHHQKDDQLLLHQHMHFKQFGSTWLSLIITDNLLWLQDKLAESYGLTFNILSQF